MELAANHLNRADVLQLLDDLLFAVPAGGAGMELAANHLNRTDIIRLLDDLLFRLVAPGL